MKKIIVAGLMVFSALVQAQSPSWPDKPINMIVGFPAGGPTDLAARTLAPSLQASLGQIVIVENKPGATGTIAAAQVKRANPDGYTVFVSSIGTFVVAPHLLKQVNYDALNDFDYISLPFQAPNVLVTGSSRLDALSAPCFFFSKPLVQSFPLAGLSVQ